MRSFKAEQGSPRGAARFGFAAPLEPSTMTAADRAAKTQDLANRRPLMGWCSELPNEGRDPPASNRSHLNQKQEDHRARDGVSMPLSACERTLPEAERVALRTQLNGDLKRMGRAHALGPGLTNAAYETPRDAISSTERGRLRNKITDEKIARGWGPVERTHISTEAKAAWDARNTTERDEKGWFTPKDIQRTPRGSRLHTEAERDHLRKDFDGKMDDGRSRMGFGAWRDTTPDAVHSQVKEAAVEARSRLGFLEKRTQAPEAVWQKQAAGMNESRSRLGFTEEQHRELPATRKQLDAVAYENRSRVGFLVSSPRHPLSKADPKHRTKATAELRATVMTEGQNLRSRAGFCEERTQSTGALRSSADEYRKENRERLGMCGNDPTPPCESRAHFQGKRPEGPVVVRGKKRGGGVRVASPRPVVEV